jgi:hypothetical protein
MLKMIHKGTTLSPEQIAVLEKQPVEILSLSPRNFRKAVDTALSSAGLPVPDITVGQVVSWEVGDQVDKGRVVSYDERADKYRLTSKLRKRDVTVAGRDIRVLTREEQP